MEGERDGRVVVTLHENFVREHIRYTDRRTGEEREFNQARVPSGTVVGGTDYGGWEFTPLSVGPSALRGERWRDLPLPADRQVLLRRSVLDAEGNLLGRGVSRYSADEMVRVRGLSLDVIERFMPEKAGTPAIHRDELLVF